MNQEHYRNRYITFAKWNRKVFSFFAIPASIVGFVLLFFVLIDPARLPAQWVLPLKWLAYAWLCTVIITQGLLMLIERSISKKIR